MEKFEMFCNGNCPIENSCRMCIQNMDSNQIETLTGTLPSQYNQETNSCNYYKPIITNELFEWLKKEFYWANHSKYRKYFDEWITNITLSQLEGFRKQMIGQIEGSKINHG